MSKGGSTTSTTTSNQSDLASAALPYYQDLISRAQTNSQVPYTPYTGQRLADFSANTNQAFTDIQNQAASGGGQPAVQQGINAATTSSQYQPTSVLDANISQYMNPYTQNVLDVQKNQANQDYQEQQAARDSAAVQAGAFGGDRRFVQDSLAQRDLNNQLQNIEATGLNNAYNNATSLFQQDQTNKLNAANLGINAAQTLGQLGSTYNQLGLDNAQALSAVGAKQQEQQQAGLDIAYQDFQNQKQWPSQQLQLYSQLLSGTQGGNAGTGATTTTTTTPTPDFLSQLTGLGTSAAGISSLLGLLGSGG